MAKNKKTGILIINLGTPQSFKKKDVSAYLREFLMDGRVIDIPWWKRWLLVNLIIVPFRTSKVAREYQKLWMEGGSPLLVFGKQLVTKLKRLFAENVEIELAMRYQEPSIEKGLQKLQQAKAEQLVILPLFPQYASATTGSVTEKVMKIISTWNIIPSVRFVNSFHRDEGFIRSFANKVDSDLDKYRPEHVLFSYHGIPYRHLQNMNKDGVVYCNHAFRKNGACRADSPYCYRSACFETSRMIAGYLGISTENYTTSFQSRLGKSPWIKPYTDKTIQLLAGKGIQNLLVVSPSFVADCLETTLEIGEQYRNLFLKHGGKNFYYTESLNSDDEWINALGELIGKEIGKGYLNQRVSTPRTISFFPGDFEPESPLKKTDRMLR